MADLNQVRRRADEFARLTDGDMPSPSPVQDPEFARAMELVSAMREAGSVEPRPEFSAALRRRLMAQAEARITATPHFPSEPDLPGDPDDDYYADPLDADSSEDSGEGGDEDDEVLVEPTPLHAARRGRLIAGAAAFVLLAGGVGSAAAAQQSMPGDPLYALKRGLESVASKASVTDDSRGRRELSHALARLTEAEQLMAAAKTNTGNTSNTGKAGDTLGDFSNDTRAGGKHLLQSFQSDNDATVIEKIYVFAADAKPRLEALARQAAIRPAVVDAAGAVNAIVLQANKTCPTCLVPRSMSKQSSSPTTGTSGTVDPNEPATTNTRPSPGVTDPPAISGQPPTKKQSTDPTTGRPSSSTTTTSNPTTGPGLPSVTLPTLPSIPGSSSRSPGVPTISLPITLPTLSLPTISLPLLGDLLHPTTKPGQNGR